MIKDLRFALRSLLKRPGFVLIAVWNARASLIPAKRAAKVDPLVALRYE